MKTCTNYDVDGDDYYKPHGGCTGNPFRCFYFKPNRQYCPYMKDGYSEEKVADWWKWRNVEMKSQQNKRAKQTFFGWMLYLIIILIGIGIVFAFNWIVSFIW